MWSWEACQHCEKSMPSKKDIDVEILKLGDFEVLLVKTKPARLETKVVLLRDNISQKLIFSLINISHKHGFGCSSPKFGLPDEDSMSFLIGTIISNQRSINRYLIRFYECLEEVTEFVEEFSQQLNFDRLDLSMFEGMSIEDIYPEQLAAIRDQNYGGSWESFYDKLIDQGKTIEADVVARCVQFEEVNDKDVGLVGHKLDYFLQTFNKLPAGNIKAN